MAVFLCGMFCLQHSRHPLEARCHPYVAGAWYLLTLLWFLSTAVVSGGFALLRFIGDI
jgi:hypothetical protein